MTPSELAEVLRSPRPPRVLDVREPQEFSIVSLPGSKLLPLSELEARWQEIASWKSDPVAVLCHHGVRSRYAIGFLESAGFGQLWNVAGGIDRWSVEVDPSAPRY